MTQRRPMSSSVFQDLAFYKMLLKFHLPHLNIKSNIVGDLLQTLYFVKLLPSTRFRQNLFLRYPISTAKKLISIASVPVGRFSLFLKLLGKFGTCFRNDKTNNCSGDTKHKTELRRLLRVILYQVQFL